MMGYKIIQSLEGGIVMKKAILVIGLLLLAIPYTASASDFNGVWVVQSISSEAFMVRQVGNTILIAEIALNRWGYSYGYNVYYGTISGNTARVFSLMSTLNVDISITAYSDTEAAMTYNSCSSNVTGFYCLFPPGYQIPIVKIF